MDWNKIRNEYNATYGTNHKNTKSMIVDMYFDERMEIDTIADTLGVKRSAVIDKIELYKTTPTEYALKVMAIKGWKNKKMKDIAEILGVSISRATYYHQKARVALINNPPPYL